MPTRLRVDLAGCHAGAIYGDRYKSRYITSEDYLYVLIRYIENNPIEAKLSHKAGEYPFTLASLILNAKEHYPCSNESLLMKEFDIKTLDEFLDASLSEDELEYLQEKEKQKVEIHSQGC